jgi:hypothetical protein
MITVGTRVRFTRNLFIGDPPRLVAARGELGTLVSDSLATWDRGGGLHFEVKSSDFTVEKTEECDVEFVEAG